MESTSANPKQTSVESEESISKRQDPAIKNPALVTKAQQDRSESIPSNSRSADFELKENKQPEPSLEPKVEAYTSPDAENTVTNEQEKSSNNTPQLASGLPSDFSKTQVEHNVAGAQNGSNIAKVAVSPRGSPKNCNSLESIAHANVPHDDPDFPYDFGNVIDALEPAPQKEGLGSTLEAAGTALIEAAEEGLIAMYEKVFGQSADEESTSSAPLQSEDNMISDPCGTTYTEEKSSQIVPDASNDVQSGIAAPSSAAGDEEFDPSVPLGSLGVEHIEPEIDQSIPLGSLGVKHVKPYRRFHSKKSSLVSSSDGNQQNPLIIYSQNQANQGTSNGLTLDTSFTTPFDHEQYMSSGSKNSDMLVQRSPEQGAMTSSDLDEGIQGPVAQKDSSPMLHDVEPTAMEPKQVR